MIAMQIKILLTLVLLLMILILSLLSGFLMVKQLMKVAELKIYFLNVDLNKQSMNQSLLKS